MTVRVGTAGWAVPRAVADHFPAEGSGLQRYAARFPAVEINSTFYRSHRPATWARWRETTPDGFRFAVKAPRTITHERRLVGTEASLGPFLDEVRQLGGKLGPLLVQSPPSLAFDAAAVGDFFAALRARFDGQVACEPRHATWFTPAADILLQSLRIARVAADPACHPGAGEPGGWEGLAYWRLHGSPRMYYSAYAPGFLAALAEKIQARAGRDRWCIFDNTTSGAAAADALRLLDRLAA